jgi:hypothetical protein
MADEPAPADDPKSAQHPAGYRIASPEEIEAIRQDMREVNRIMVGIVASQGIKTDPRIEAIRSKRRDG